MTMTRAEVYRKLLDYCRAEVGVNLQGVQFWKDEGNNEEIVEAYKQDVEFFTAAVELLEEECPFHLRMLELRK